MCTHVQILSGSREVGRNKVELKVGNNPRVDATAAGSANLILPSGRVIYVDIHINSNKLYNVQTKESESDGLDRTLIWQCHLGHISEQRVSALYKVRSARPIRIQKN